MLGLNSFGLFLQLGTLLAIISAAWQPMMAHLVVGKFVPGEVQSIFEVGLVNAGLTIGSNLEIVNKNFMDGLSLPSLAPVSF